MSDHTININITQDPCPGCDGKGYQMGSDGITITCLMCHGSGVWSKSYDSYPYYPYHGNPYPYYGSPIISDGNFEF